MFVIAGVALAFWTALLVWAARRRRRGGRGASAVEAWNELFQPSHRHVREERDRRLVLRDDTESGVPPNSVDLDAGTAFIRRTPG
ncbi:DUF6191 domain-containing protein [Streptomyces diastaticus]|uniref:DUF6191 domain-containing protein n=1 Tax=Streptomyces diastaticus TaxID=1956 RepID=UPI0036C18BBE